MMNNSAIITDFIEIYNNFIDKNTIEFNGNDFTFKITDSADSKKIEESFDKIFTSYEKLLIKKIFN